MTRIAASIDITVSPSLCIHAIQEAMTDDRLLAAYRSLRKGKEYSGFVTMLVPDRRMVIEFASLDPASNRRSHATGWKVIYDFTPAGDGRTRVEIAIEYGRLTAIATGGLARPQAENDIVHRLSAMRMLEVGAHGLPPGEGGAPLP